MRKIISLMMCLMTAAAMTACTASADQHTGEAQGYGGPLRVTVSLNGSDITAVNVVEHSETPGVGTRAIDALPAAIADKDSVEVDSVSGATVTSEAIKAAVRDALDLDGGLPEKIPAPNSQDATPALEGMGMAATGRVGPGKDAQGNQVYAFNVVFAHGSFDEEGRIRSVKVDQLEVASPNRGEGSSLFSGFPGEGVETEAFMKEIEAWTTKGAKGEGYMLGSGSWREQMNAYESMMVGKTVKEVDDWFARLFDPETGKPLSSGEAWGALSEEDRRSAAEVTSRATMSLRDEHGNILLAIHRAWEDAQKNKQPSGEGMMIDTNTDLDMTGQDETVG